MKNTHYNLIDTLRHANIGMWALAIETYKTYKNEKDFMEAFPIAYFRKYKSSHLLDSVTYTYYDCVRWAFSDEGNNYGV